MYVMALLRISDFFSDADDLTPFEAAVDVVVVVADLDTPAGFTAMAFSSATNLAFMLVR